MVKVAITFESDDDYERFLELMVDAEENGEITECFSIQREDV